MSPDESSPQHLLPLILRNSKGTVVAFDGSPLQKRPYSIMLFLVDRGDTVVPIVGTFGSDLPGASVSFATNTEPTIMAKTMANMVNSVALSSGHSVDGSIFKTSETAGTYHRRLVGALARYVDHGGAIRGDASTGMSEQIVLAPDGKYRGSTTMVVNGEAGKVDRDAGTWKLVGDTLVIHYADTKRADLKLLVMGMGQGRDGKHSVAYFVDSRYVDRFWFQMFVDGTNPSDPYFERSAAS